MLPRTGSRTKGDLEVSILDPKMKLVMDHSSRFERLPSRISKGKGLENSGDGPKVEEIRISGYERNWLEREFRSYFL
jgi:hypothetical protein